MKIKTFGYITEIIGTSDFELDNPINLKEFRKNLENKFPELKTKNFSIAVNEEVINDDDFIIEKDAEIALLPPFSGG